MHFKTLTAGFFCGLLLAPAMAFAADSAAKADAGKAVSDTPFVIVAPSEEIIVTFPLFVMERGVVEDVDAKAGVFTLKEQDGSLSKIKVTENTVIENVYLDIFTWESKKGIDDLKKGEKVRARVFPPDDIKDPSIAVSLDVYKF